MSDIVLMTTPEGRLVVCDICDHAVDTNGEPVQLVTPKNQITLKTSCCTCNKCRQWRSWERLLYGNKEITLSPLVARRVR